MPSGGNNRINFQVGFNVDKSSLDQVSAAFQKLRNFKFSDFKGTKEQLIDIKTQAQQVENALNNAFNSKLNSVNIKQFQSELQKNNLSVEQIHSNFSKLGAVGQNAFNTMSTSVLTSNLQLKQTSSLVQNIGTTLMNTAKWTVASGAIRAFTGSISQAFTYVKSLDSSLNDIRIVTKDSADEMSNFATQANRAATELGRSTLDYTKAALTFYQQGLDDQQVMARTQATLKAQNITGAGAQMADYLTAVWNGYKVANEQAELYVDKLAAVADSSASNMSQLAVAMSKVASSANLLGVPVDSLNAQIATIVATTRQAPESVGNALKTIYSRINDISTGADDAEISLGNYSKKMLEVGISVLDANGKLRNTGDVIEEIGQKWETLSHEQQIYLARTMAGQRQYNNLLALFENWGKYTDLVNVSLESQGATAEKNAIYMESLAAHTEQLGVAQERLKSSMVDSDSYKSMLDVATSGVTLMANFIQSIGGGGNALLMFGSIFTQLFSGTIAKEINNVITNMQNVKHNAQMVAARIDFLNAHTGQSGQDSTAARVLNDVKSIYADITDQQKIQLDTLIKQQAEEDNKVKILQEEIDKANQLKNTMAQAMNVKQNKNGYNWQDFAQKVDIAHGALDNLKTSLDKVDGSANKLTNKKILAGLKESVLEANNALGGSNQKLAEVAEKIKYLSTGSTQVMSKSQLQAYINSIKAALQDARQELNLVDETRTDNLQANLTEAQKKARAAANATKEFTDALHSQVNIQNITKGIAGIGQLASGIISLTNLTKIWGNENLSTGEKILQTFTNLSMSIGMITSALGNIRKGWQGLSAIISAFGQKTVVMQALQTAGNISLAKSEELATNEAVKQAAAQSGVSTTAFAQVVAMKQAEGATLEQAIAAAQAAFANQTLAKSFGKILITALPYIAAIGGIAALIYGIVKAINAQRDAMIEAQQAAKDSTQHLNNLKQSANELRDSISKYNELSTSLDELTKGTDEWNQKLQQSNDLVLQLIQKFPELYDAVHNVNGKLVLSEDALQGAQARMNEIVAKANISNVNMQENARIASINYSASQLASQSGIVRTDETGSYIDKLSSQTVQEIAKIFNDELIKNDGKNNDELAKIIAKEVGASQELVKSLLQNEEGLKNLATSIQQNTNITQLAYQTQAANSVALSENQAYKNSSQIDKAIMQKVAGVDLQKAIDTAEQTWYNKLTGSGISKGSGNQNAIYQEALKALQEAGYNIKQATDGNGVLGTDSNRRLAFKLEGEQVQLRAAEVASMIAASQALKNLGQSAENTKEALQKLDTGVKDSDTKTAVREFLAGNTDFSDFTKAQLDNFKNSGAEIQEWASQLDIDVLKGLGFNSAEEFVEGFQEATVNAIDAFEKVLEGKSRQVKEVFNKIDLKDASLGIQKEISEKLQLAFNKGGTQAAEQLGQFYQKAFDFGNLEDIEGLQLDFNNISVNQFQTALKQAGITTKFTTQQLQAYILAQKNTAQATRETLQQRYSDIHSIIDKLKNGDTISAENAQKLKDAGIEIDNYFDRMLDGSYKIEKNAEEFVEYANNISLDGFRQNLEELSNDIAAGNIVKNSAYYQSDFNAFSSSADFYNSETGQQQVDQRKIDIQLKYLQLLGNESQIKKEIQENGQASVQQARLLAKQVEKYASQYENVPDIIKDQKKELSEEKKALQEAQKAAKRLNKQLDKDVNKDRLEALKNYFNTTEVQGYATIFQEDQYAAEELAEELLRYESALQRVKTKQDEWREALNSTNTATQALAKSELRNVYSDILGISEDVFGDEFLKNLNNLDLLNTLLTKTGKEAEDAYNSLQKAALLQIIPKVLLDDTEFRTKLQSLWIQAQKFKNNAEIKVGAKIDDTDFINALNHLLAATATTKTEAQAILKEFGVTANVSYKKVKVPTKVKVPKYHTETQRLGGQGPKGPNLLVDPTDYQQVVVFDGFEEKVQYSEIPSWTIAGDAYKAPTGPDKIPYSPDNDDGGDGGGNPTSSTPKRQYIKKNPAKKPYQKTPEKNRKEIIYDPYEQNTKQLEKESDILDKLAQQEQRISGKDRLKNLKAQNEQLEKQNKTLQERQKISDDAKKRGSTSYVKKQLQDTFGDKIKFDEDGQISSERIAKNWAASNYNTTEKQANEAIKTAQKQANDIAAAANKAYEDWRKKYNRKSAEAQQKEYDDLSDLDKRRYSSVDEYQKAQRDKAIEDAKKEADKIITQQQKIKKKAEEQYQYRIKLIEQYGQLWKKDQQAWDQYVDNLSKILENKFASLKLKVDLSLQTGDIERQWLNFRDKFISPIKDNQFAKQASSAVKEMLSYTDSGQLQATLQGLQASKNMLNKLQKGNDKTVISTIQKLLGYDMKDKDDKAAWKKLMKEQGIDSLRQQATALAQQQLKEYLASAQEQLIAMQEQAEKVREILLNAVNKWNEDMKSVISQYQRIGDIIDHNRKLSEMLFGDKAYDVMLKYYRKQYTNSNNQLKRLVEYKNQQMEQYQLYKNSDKERAELALKNAQDYTNQINSLMENMVDNLQKRWEIAAESAIQKFRDGLKLDLANNEWDYINKFDNAFLDPVETKIGLEEIEALYNDAAKELSGNREQQEKINKLGKQQLEQLKNKKNITKYDIERAKAVLDIEKQRYALQDAREKKVQIRLRRDSQGNYTYRYVSQAEEVTNAQQAYAKAQYDLYEKDKQHYKGVLNDMNQLTEEYSSKRMELEQEMSKALAQNDTGRLNRLNEELTLLDNWYEKLWKAHAEDKQFTLGQYLTESFSMNMNLDPKDADTLKTMKESLDFVGSTLDKTIDKITKKNGLIEALKGTFDSIRENTMELITDVQQLGKTAGITSSDSESFLQALTDPSTRKEAGKTLSAIGKIIAEQEKMITPLQQVVDATGAQVEQVDKLLKDSNEFIKNLKEGSGIISQLLAGYNALQQSNDYTDNGIAEGTGFTTDSKNTVQYVQDLLSQVSENIKTKIMQLFDRPQSYATGGYTGDWGEQGRLAYLHEKELVLNANDTANILAAVGTLRDMTSRMSIGESLNALAAEQSGLLSTLYNSRQQLDQNVHIEANFPNVRDHLEIEKAFDNLINIASMYASKRQ